VFGGAVPFTTWEHTAYMKYNAAALVLTQKSTINQKAVLGNGGI